ncbi:flagellar filament outer layer protein FlaA [Leptospira sp. 96542]|nr:flagellar filament outer layer protein FlaA [Leptospira sp. 96542]
MIKKFNCLTLGILLSIQPTFSLPKPYDPDELGRVNVLSQALKIDPSYMLFLAEDFEGERPWSFYRPDSFLAHTEFGGNLSGNDAFLAEGNLLKQVGYSQFQNQTSFLIQSFVENPRLDHWEIRPKEPIHFPLGMPIQAIVWVYSEGHHINLSMALSQKKSKDILFDFGLLNFVGWRRLELPLTLPKENTRLIQSQSFPVAFKSFFLKTRASQKRGAFHLYFDNLSFVIDKRTFTYPGAEVMDTWGSRSK